MITHKTFSYDGFTLTHAGTLGKWEKVRVQAEQFIAEEIKEEEDLITITETAVGANGPHVLAITVWYRKS